MYLAQVTFTLTKRELYHNLYNSSKPSLHLVSAGETYRSRNVCQEMPGNISLSVSLCDVSGMSGGSGRRQ